MSCFDPAVARIENAVAGVPGWSPVDQLFALYTLCLSSSHLPGEVVELGAWCGRSAIALGLAVQDSGGGTVHSVDLFPHRDDWYRNTDGSYSFAVQIGGRRMVSYDQQTVWAEPFERDIAPLYAETPDLFGRFVNTIAQSNLQSTVAPFRGDLRQFIDAMPADFRCRLAFLDGHHSYEAVASDIEMIERVLVPGGWLCFDDAFTSYDGVDRAIRERILERRGYANAQQLTRKLFVAQRFPAG